MGTNATDEWQRICRRRQKELKKKNNLLVTRKAKTEKQVVRKEAKHGMPPPNLPAPPPPGYHLCLDILGFGGVVVARDFVSKDAPVEEFNLGKVINMDLKVDLKAFDLDLEGIIQDFEGNKVRRRNKACRWTSGQ